MNIWKELVRSNVILPPCFVTIWLQFNLQGTLFIMRGPNFFIWSITLLATCFRNKKLKWSIVVHKISLFMCLQKVLLKYSSWNLEKVLWVFSVLRGIMLELWCLWRRKNMNIKSSLILVLSYTNVNLIPQL